jgi:putative membrane protein
MSVLISWIFNVMEIVGDRSENPFENGVNDIRMTAICRTVEIDLREMLGEKDISGRIYPVNNIIM